MQIDAVKTDRAVVDYVHFSFAFSMVDTSLLLMIIVYMLAVYYCTPVKKTRKRDTKTADEDNSRTLRYMIQTKRLATSVFTSIKVAKKRA